MTQPHPVLACMDAMGAALKDVVDVDPAFMTVEDKRAALVGLASVAARLDELRLRVLADADDVAADDGARDPAAWLVHHTRIDAGAARRQLRLGLALGERRDDLRRALAAGSVNIEQVDTNLADGVLLCSSHHHRAHDARYDVSRHADGSVRFHLRR